MGEGWEGMGGFDTETLFGDCWAGTKTEAESLIELTEWQARVQRDKEMIVASLLAVPTPLHLCDDWQRMVQEFTFEESELEGSRAEAGVDSPSRRASMLCLLKQPDWFVIS
jgi:hypothetical protein